MRIVFLKCNDDCQHVRYLTAHGYSSNGTGTVELPGDEEVGQSIECLQKAGEQIRNI